MSVHMPKDDHNKSFPAFRYKANGTGGSAINQAVTTASATLIALPTGAKLISFWAEDKVKFEFGDNTVVADANSHAADAGALEFVPLVDPYGKVSITHMSVIADGANTIIHISERE